MSEKNIPSVNEQLSERGKIPYSQKLKERVIIPCSMCGKPIEMQFKSYRRIELSGKPPKCRTCLGKENHEYYNNLPDEEKKRRAELSRVNTSQQWANMDEEARRKHTSKAVEAMRTFRENATDEQKEAIRKKQSISHKAYFSGLSEEEKRKRMEPMREGARKFYQGLDEEEKKKRIQAMEEGKQNWWKNASEEEKDRMREIRSKASRDYWYEKNGKKISDNESKMIRKWWRVMKPSEFYAYAGNNITLEDLNDILLNPVEKEFSVMLMKKKVSFDPKRPNHTINENDKEQPVYIWGFSIHNGDDESAVYIDVDDSRYDPDKKPLQTITDKEERRTHHTDGKPVYIVEAYDDVVTPKTKVRKLGDENIITVKELLEILPK